MTINIPNSNLSKYPKKAPIVIEKTNPPITTSIVLEGEMGDNE